MLERTHRKYKKDYWGIVLIILVVLFITGVVGWLIYSQISEHYAKNDPTISKLKKLASKLFERDRMWSQPLAMLNKRDVMKEVEVFKGNKSYTINKKRIYMCLRDEKGDVYDMNSLIYVLLHEYAHSLCKSVGHTEEFHTIFQALLREAERINIYDSRIPMAEPYCEHT